MKCPFCGSPDSQVKDSRPADDGVSIKRRRYCAECDSRFTTYERVMLRELMVVKSNGERRPLDRDKIHRSITIATRKRPVSEEQVEGLVNKIVRQIEMSGESEIPSARIGELVMQGLQSLDQQAVGIAARQVDVATRVPTAQAADRQRPQRVAGGHRLGGPLGLYLDIRATRTRSLDAARQKLDGMRPNSVQNARIALRRAYSVSKWTLVSAARSWP